MKTHYVFSPSLDFRTITSRFRGVLALFAVLGLFATNAFATLVTISATGASGSYKTGSVDATGTKNDDAMIDVNSFANRGWAVFDLSGVPSGAIINSVTVNFTTFTSDLSFATNYIGGFVGDPATMSGSALYSALDANSTNSFDASTWDGDLTIDILNTKVLNFSGVNFISANTGGSVVLSFVRGGSINFNIYGFGATPGSEPQIIIDYTPPTPCAGVPTVGTTATTNASVCPAVPFTVSLPSILPGTGGLVYQWQSSPTGTGFTNITGATSSTYSTTQSTDQYYQCVVTCVASSQTATSVPVLVTTNSFISCYPSSGATNTDDEDIYNVTFGTLNNSSDCSTTAPGPGSAQNLYSNYTTSVAAPSILLGLVTPFSVEIGTCGLFNFNNAIKIFIDLNQNGSLLDAGEEVYVSPSPTSGPHVESGNLILPMTATPGQTLMRIVNDENFNPSSISPYGTYFYGETEDYLVDLVMPPPCTGVFAGNVASTDSTVCPTQAFTLSMPNGTLAANLTYQWQSSPDNATWTNTGTSTAYFTTTTATDSFYRCIATCTNDGTIDISSSLLISVNSFIECYCGGSTASYSWSNIGQVAIGSDANPVAAPSPLTFSTASIDLYSDFTSLTPFDLTINGPKSVSITQIDQYSFTPSAMTVYIDLDQSGTFDPGEDVFNASSGAGNPMNGIITIPIGTPTGLTGMRVILEEYGITPLDPCSGYFAGETEDYRVNIKPQSAIDASVQAIISPVDGCSLNTPSSITVKVANVGLMTLLTQ